MLKLMLHHKPLHTQKFATKQQWGHTQAMQKSCNNYFYDIHMCILVQLTDNCDNKIQN